MKFSNPLRQNKYIPAVVVISAMVAILIHFPESISLFEHVEHDAIFPKMKVVDVVNEIAFTFVSLLVMFWLNTLVFGYNDPQKRIGWLKFTGSFIFTWLISNAMAKAFVMIHTYYDIPAIDSMLHNYLHPLRDFIISCVVTSSCYIIHLVLKQQKMLVENQLLRTESLRNQYEALKNQLNPHMLFNSLNTLQALIRDQPIKAQNYTQELSKVLRYTLQGNEAQCVQLREEMKFVDAYIYLLKMRYEDNLKFMINIDSCYDDFRLPPMSVQLLIENAVKHNEISSRRQLTISITSTSDSMLEVSNPIHPKRTSTTGTAIGLSNLELRYSLLFKKSIEFVIDKETFCVKLPLINRAEHESSDC